MAHILVVDDEANLRTAIVTFLRIRGYSVDDVATGEEARERYARVGADVIVLDMVLPGVTGLDVLTTIRQLDANVVCIFITAHGSVPGAVEAMRAGAYDYVTKPFDNNDLILAIERAVQHRQLLSRVVELEQVVSARSEFTSIVGRSPAIEHVLRRLAKVARSETTVLLLGETGTGKELAALSLHRGSPRAGGPFVAVNCGAIPASLAEDELFGHVRGAFTDARTERRGRFEQARGGTLFLDEVGDLSADLQVKLLRAIQERQISPIGSEQSRDVDVRLIAATNRSLSQEVAEGRFRSDLFWRLNVFQVEMPPLRGHLEDLAQLTSHLLDRVNAECRTDVRGVTTQVQARFEAYAWPGNVRELMNVLRHGVLMTEDTMLGVRDLPDYLLAEMVPPSPMGSSQTLERALAETEKRLVQATVERFKGNRSAAAEALGIDRRTLYNKLRQYDGASNDQESGS
jgi:two-component system response regulator AtoC